MKKLLFLLLAFSCNRAMAQQKMSVQDCIDYALKNQTKLKNSSLDEQIQFEKNAQLATAVYPQINFSGNLSAFPIVPKSRSRGDLFDFSSALIPMFNPTAFNPNYRPQPAPEYNELQFGLPYNGSCTLSVSQIIFNSDVFIALQARQTILDLTKLNTKRSQEDLKVDVSKAYYNSLIAQERVKSLAENILLIEKFEQNMKGLYKEGFVEKIDVDKLTVQKNNLINEKNKVDNLIILADQLLKFQMGMPLNNSIVLTESLEKAEGDAQMLLVKESDFRNRIEYQLLNTAEKLNDYNTTRIKNSWMPTVVAFGNLGASTAAKKPQEIVTLPWFPSSIIGLQVSMGIFDGGKRQHALKEAKLAAMKTTNDKLMFEQAVDFQVTAARTTLNNTLKTLQNQKSNVALAQKVYNVATQKSKEGVGSTIEVMQAQTALKDAQTNYLGALYDATIAQIDLQKALGNFNK